MRTLLGALMMLVAFVGWSLIKANYGSAGIIGNMLFIGLAVGGYYVIRGKPKK